MIHGVFYDAVSKICRSMIPWERALLATGVMRDDKPLEFRQLSFTPGSISTRQYKDNPMKATLAAGVLALASLGLAFGQYNTAQGLRQQLQDSENRSASLAQQIEAQTDANTRLQDSFEQQINTLQENLQSSSRQLVILSESLQQTREMLNQNAPAALPAIESSAATFTEPSAEPSTTPATEPTAAP